jgi:flagellar protein FlbD
MIRLTRLNNQSLIVNSDLIKFIEAAPDTVLTLVNGEKIIVRESGHQILEQIIEFRRRLLDGSARGFSVPEIADRQTTLGSEADPRTGSQNK